MTAKCADPQFRAASLAARPQAAATLRISLATPEGRARLETAQRRGQAQSLLVRTKAAWPEEYRQAYRELTRQRHVTAKEADRIIREQMVADARRAIKDVDRRQRERAAREQAQAY